MTAKSRPSQWHLRNERFALVVGAWLLANKAPQSIFLIEIHWEQAILERLWIEAAFCIVDLTSRIASVALIGRAPHS